VRFLTTFAQLDAGLNLRMSKSLGRPVLPYPFSTTDEAPKNNLPASRATAAIATMFEFSEVAASTLIFA
jgi:hypothetical protein